jgi:hypothetical protein
MNKDMKMNQKNIKNNKTQNKKDTKKDVNIKKRNKEGNNFYTYSLHEAESFLRS